MHDVAVGNTVHGHKLIEKIGEGHYGEVWRAEYLGHPVALKLFNGDRRVAHLKREAFAQYALGRLDGSEARWFPRVEHIGLDADPPFMRMEFVDGTPLEDLLINPSFSLEERLSIGEMVLRALSVVHRHDFVHGDLSPLNVLVTPERSVRLIDVGYGALFDEGTPDIAVSTAAEDRPMGVASPLYSAPERFKSGPLEGCGKPADIFSFGKLLYRLISGEQPFVIKPVSRRYRALGTAWDEFLFKCLEERPEARFADAEAALEEYRRIYRPALAPGEYRSECPECKAAQSIPGGWAGERFDCRGCGRKLEVLFYDDPSRYATTALVGPVELDIEPDIQFIEGDADTRARKFCPSCGGEMKVEARKCRHCGVWVDEVARQLVAERNDKRRRDRAERVAERHSFVFPAIVTFLGYLFFWLPGVILNWYFLNEAEIVERQAGQQPPGMAGLKFLLWVFLYLPLIALAVVVILAILSAVFVAMFA